MEEDAAVMDQISELPDAIIRNILFRLPMKNVVQTSLVSKKWRHHWTFNPNLEFNYCPWKKTDIVPLINRSIAAYQGTHIRKFLLDAFPQKDISKEIEKWIDFAVGKHVSVLDLNVFMAPHFEDPCFYFEAPVSLFSCGSIETLKLNNCIFSPPLGFEGFASLKTLCLRNTRISEETVAQVLSKSPLLETLLLHEPEGIRFLKIYVPTPRLSHIVVHGDHIKGIEISAPGLQILDFTGNPETLVVSAPRLVKAIFPTLLSVRGSGDLTARVLRDWASTLAQFSNVLALTVNMHFLMLLYANCYMNGSNPRIKFQYLKYLHVVGDLDETYGVSALVNFFRNCPGLTKVMIEAQPHHNSGSWVCEYMRTEQVRPIIVTDEEEVVKKLGGGVVGSAAAAAVDFSDFDDLVHLELIIMRGFSGNAREMMFAKFLLQKAAVLDVLVLEWLQPCYCCYNPAVINELSALATKSSHAKIRERRCVET